jgi:hypothetical protein
VRALRRVDPGDPWDLGHEQSAHSCSSIARTVECKCRSAAKEDECQSEALSLDVCGRGRADDLDQTLQWAVVARLLGRNL